ncbi:MAG: LPS-assembly protein LptD [Alphaproteobacteria bacterium]
MFRFKLFPTLVLLSLSVPAFAQGDVSKSPVDLQADRLVHDESGQKVTARGDVILIQDGKTVKADEIIYYLQDDKVIAIGNVEFTDVTGDRHLSDRVEFSNALKDGFVEGLTTFLADGSRFKASNGRHEGGQKTLMKDAFYTPCDTCKGGKDIVPLWQIRASEVEHDKETKTVAYRNARFEVKGMPVAYFPYFSHPDNTVKRKSGFLTPSAGYKSDLGAFIQSSYYWSIAPDKDATFGVVAMTNEAPLGLVEWRQRWKDASLKANGSFTYSERTDSVAGVDVIQDRELRGNLEIDGRWDINNKWRSGVKIDVTSDDQYLRQYDFDSDNVLENEIYAERFSGRNYAAARLLAFQDVRIEENRQDQPHVLPEIEAHFLGEPGDIPVFGGRWSADASILGIVRDDDQQDVNRLYAALGWKRRLVSDYGFVSTVDLHGQTAFYRINDRDGTADDNSDEVRSFAYANFMTSYPVVKAFESAQAILEPVASITIAPHLGGDDEIPNEDSQDVQLDSLNLFEANRFPGVDGVEDQTHVTYGLKGGLYGHEGSFGEAFLGQSYRFDEDDNPFGQGSGLDDQNSDLVGRVSGGYQNDYRLDYRFQLDNENLSSQRHEVDATLKFDKLTLSSQYLFAKGLEGTDIDATREQIKNSAEYYIDDQWRLFGSARHDLGDDPGLRKANLGLDYIGQCVSWSIIGEKTLTDDASGDSATEIFLRIGFKNLGELATSGVQVGGSGE